MNQKNSIMGSEFNNRNGKHYKQNTYQNRHNAYHNQQRHGQDKEQNHNSSGRNNLPGKGNFSGVSLKSLNVPANNGFGKGKGYGRGNRGKSKKKSYASWYFLLAMIAVYFVVFLYNGALFNRSMIFFYHILLKIIPVFVFVYVLMVLTDYYVTPQFVIKHLSGRGLKKWIYVVLGGMVSSGPIYMWYPLLAELRDKGLSYRLITCFLYNRAIKIALIPLAIFYFGWVYVLVLTLVMIFISIVQGFFMEWIMLKGSGNVSS